MKQKLGGLIVAIAVLVPATPAAATVQPGSPIESDGAYCTLAWIFDGTDTRDGPDATSAPYATTAAHCVERTGSRVNLASGSLGEVLEPIGTVVLRGDPDTDGRDYAVIKIDAAVAGQLNPAVAGHPDIPTGVSRFYAHGDLMQFSGNGVGFDATAPTREQRVGVLNAIDGSHHDIIGGVTPGDSGGPVADLTDGKTAFGIVNTVGAGVNTSALTVATVGEGGTNVDFVIQHAALQGLNLRLKTVP